MGTPSSTSKPPVVPGQQPLAIAGRAPWLRPEAGVPLTMPTRSPGLQQPWYANQLAARRSQAIAPEMAQQLMLAREIAQRQALAPKSRFLRQFQTSESD